MSSDSYSILICRRVILISQGKKNAVPTFLHCFLLPILPPSQVKWKRKMDEEGRWREYCWSKWCSSNSPHFLSLPFDWRCAWLFLNKKSHLFRVPDCFALKLHQFFFFLLSSTFLISNINVIPSLYQAQRAPSDTLPRQKPL